jgi:hypothetical protein
VARTVEFLQALAASRFPKEVADQDELDLLRLVRAAGWVDAEFPAGQRCGLVKGITFAGRVFLEKAAQASR